MVLDADFLMKQFKQCDSSPFVSPIETGFFLELLKIGANIHLYVYAMYVCMFLVICIYK